MNTGTLDVFHNPRDQYLIPINYCVDFNFAPLEILIYENRVPGCSLERAGEIPSELGHVVHYFHRATP